jgi:hypothetical protein
VGSFSCSRKLALILPIFFTLLLIPTVFSQNPLVLTSSTDKTQYAPGETVTITGRVSDNQSNPIPGVSLSIQLSDPPIAVQFAVSDQTGAYSNQFVLPDTLPAGAYTIYISADKSGYTTAQQQLQFTVPGQTTTSSVPSTITSTIAYTSTISTSTQTIPQTKCFIATATYGSELAPEVVLLRTFRDSDILHTSAGRGFMVSFNAFYYSFSPQVASIIALNAPLRFVMKAALYPLIGILSISYTINNLLAFNMELAVTLAGIFAAMGIGIIYFGPVAIGICKLCRLNKSSIRILSNRLAGACVASLLILIMGETFNITSVLMFASVAIVLSFVFFGAVSTVQLVQLLNNRRIARARNSTVV